MTIFLTVIHVIVCLLLILVILLQAGRGQGLTGPSFSSGNVQSLFGTRATDFLSKATTVSAICFIFTCIGLDYFEIQKSKSLLDLSKPTQQMDVDAIKKALEKIKEEGTKTTAGTADKATEAGAAAVQQVQNAATNTANSVSGAAANLLDQAKSTADGAAAQTAQAVNQAANTAQEAVNALPPAAPQEKPAQ